MRLDALRFACPAALMLLAPVVASAGCSATNPSAAGVFSTSATGSGGSGNGGAGGKGGSGAPTGVGGQSTSVTSGTAGSGGTTGAGGATAGTGGQAGSGGQAVNPAVAQACADLAKASCTQRDACTNGIANQVKYGSLATCEAREALACVARLTAPGTSATPASTEACAAALPGEACPDFLDNNPAMACQPQSGSGAAMSMCSANAQCQSAYCSFSKGFACGICSPAPQAGDTCATAAECGYDQDCPKGTLKCTAYVASGGTCGPAATCGAGLVCVGPMPTVSGTCQAQASSVGATCDPKRVAGPDCDLELGLHCNPLTKACEAAGLVAPGATCGAVNGNAALCTEGSLCVRPMATSKTGTCVAAAADGAACGGVAGPPCLAPARCITSGGASGTCQLPGTTPCP